MLSTIEVTLKTLGQCGIMERACAFKSDLFGCESQACHLVTVNLGPATKLLSFLGRISEILNVSKNINVCECIVLTHGGQAGTTRDSSLSST